MSETPRKPRGEDPTYIGIINGSDSTEYAVWVDFKTKKVWVTWRDPMRPDQETWYDFSEWPPTAVNGFKYRIWQKIKAFEESAKDPSISPNARLRQ